ncbi:DUF4194 domain-containing protein [Herpetosiphon geysericola]|uniref:DUF4194 domain-containing protein n=1 Tax=Herpetosiphon geysericola TaxID=70996 RepID=A0A0P6Z2B3_9CHLR|nr:DUF4194 domain-containing protein [Herpetosiphon geysericola]KPL91340.1 hypothetical protein SE18_02635 [Herpetosiphon geysericola]
MSLVNFAEEYSQLSSSEQQLFADSVRRLLSDGLIWREDEQDRRIFAWLVRRIDLVRDYLAVAGWELHYAENLHIFHVFHRDGSHRRRFDKEETLWLLLLRLIYAEQYESLNPSLTRYPTTTVSDLYTRYSEFFPNRAIRKKGVFDSALRLFNELKLIRAPQSTVLRANDPETVIELLPALEVIVPASGIAALAERLAEYQRPSSSDEEQA